MKYFDITPPISPKLAVFPGDVPFSREIALDMNKGHNLTLSSITTSLHIGAHADASNHYHRDGKGIEQRPLEPYLGECQVVTVSVAAGARIFPSDVKAKIVAKRVLLRTNSFNDPSVWNSKFNSLSPELVHWLADAGVVLVGIDTPSVDPEDSKALESHNAIFQRGLCILEGILLTGVSDGLFTLIALPLPIVDADASPVRAILLERGSL